jgi:hypothetical protein
LVKSVRWWRQTWEQKQELLVLASILLLATVLRIGWPTLTEFKFDEARLEALALELTRDGRLPFVGLPSSAGFHHSPLSVYLYVPAFLFTTNPIPATIYGGLVGVAAVALCWWLARHWAGGGRGAAWIAALLFAVSPWSVAFGRKIWQVVFIPFLALAFVGLLISALIEEPDPGGVHDRQWHLAWAIVAYALLVQVHPSAAALLPGLLLWLILFWRRVRPGPLIAGMVMAALTGMPFLVQQAQNGWPALGALKALPAAGWDLSAVRLAWEAITGRGLYVLAGDAYPSPRIVPELGWTFNLVGWLLVASGWWLTCRAIKTWRTTDSGLRRQARVDLVLLTWLAMPVVFNLRHNLDLQLHFFVLVLPAAYLIIGRAVQGVLRAQRTSRLRVPGTLGLGLLVGGQVVGLALMGQFVATHETPGGFGVPLRRYLSVANQTIARATQQGATEVLVVGQGDFSVVDEIPAIFDVLLRGRVAYRFVDGQSTAVFPSHPALALLTPGAGEVIGWYRSPPFSSTALEGGYLLVDLGGTSPQLQFKPLTGLRLFRNGVEAQGYTWQRDTTPGEAVKFWLLWQVVWLSPDDTHFYVHLLDEESRPLGQRDSAGYPLAYRQQGDRVVSKFDITIEKEPPAGLYWARIGQYLYPQVANVPLIDQAGNPAADAIVVGPWHRGP